jgi:hypothetical protein
MLLTQGQIASIYCNYLAKLFSLHSKLGNETIANEGTRAGVHAVLYHSLYQLLFSLLTRTGVAGVSKVGELPY